MLVMAVMVILAVSPLTAAQIMLLIDRYLGGHFFDTQAGGSAVIWMHFFWIFGHPEVYILVMPAFAIRLRRSFRYFPARRSSAIPSWWRRRSASASSAMSVWAHHMFTVGMSSNANTFFVLSTMAIAVPTGIKIFNWLATMWGGKIRFKTPMLFCIAFPVSVPDRRPDRHHAERRRRSTGSLRNSYFVVAHFHYVIVGGILFCALRRLLLLVPEDVRAGCTTRRWASCISGCSSSASI